jgi:hypothetical protein
MRNRAAHTNSNQTRWHVSLVRKTTGGKVMKFKIEMFIDKEDFAIPANKSKSMINALQREQILQLVEASIPGAMVLAVRKVQEERTCV